MDIEDIIKFENECTYVDFKLIEYKTEMRGEMIKDVIAFANADYIGDRYIIIGLKKKNQKTQFNNIDNPEDGASVQQRITSNIEPELDVTYTPINYETHKLMVLTIKNPTNPPYIISKEIPTKSGLIKKGECWVRKGERKEVASRKDFDRMFNKKLSETDFKGVINITFEASKSETLQVILPKIYELPSDRKKRDIKYYIELKKAKISLNESADPKNYLHPSSYLTTFRIARTYSDYTLDELERELSAVDENGLDNDLIYIFEEKSTLINFTILNSGIEYLKDVTIEIKIPKNPDILIFEKFQKRPGTTLIFNPANNDQLNYPHVEIKDGHYHIVEKIGNLKHKIPHTALHVPFRLFLSRDMVNKELDVICILYGENSKNPIIKQLKINVVKP